MCEEENITGVILCEIMLVHSRCASRSEDECWRKRVGGPPIL